MPLEQPRLLRHSIHDPRQQGLVVPLIFRECSYTFPTRRAITLGVKHSRSEFPALIQSAGRAIELMADQDVMRAGWRRTLQAQLIRESQVPSVDK